MEEPKPVVPPEPANPNPPSFIAAADMEGPEAAAAENSTIKSECAEINNNKNAANGRTSRDWRWLWEMNNSAGADNETSSNK